MVEARKPEFWFITGSQHLYGGETLRQVDEHSKEIASFIDQQPSMPYRIIFKPVVTTADEIRAICMAANSDANCAGLITWMHTFSPAKMWIAGLTILNKPLLHLHTQFNRDIPWGNIDMDFMNLNQSAHGDREYGFIGARLRLPRKVVVGYWQDPEVISKIAAWEKTAAGFMESKTLKVARFGDNMREVAVTEGDKVEAQIKFGWSVNGYGIGDLVSVVNQVAENEVDSLIEEYEELYDLADDVKTGGLYHENLREQAKYEIALKAFMKDGNFGAFTTNFEDLYGLEQLPGLAVQRLMAAGYGFGGEGDWKTAALTRVMKVMAGNKGTSFMEDYTYHLEPGNEKILGAHMLEVCPTISAAKPRIEVHPLGIGGKASPARLIFNGMSGKAVCASLIDLGNRFRLIVNQVKASEVKKEMDRLPVARVLWTPEPNIKIAAEAWIYAGGAHHTVFSYNVTAEQLYDWAEMNGIECILINDRTDLLAFRNELRFGEFAWK